MHMYDQPMGLIYVIVIKKINNLNLEYCRIWTRNTVVGRREDLLCGVRADRDPTHPHHVHGSGGAPHDTHGQTT